MADIFDKTTRALGASVNLRQLRNNIINSNIANAETPGYQAKKVDFEDALNRALNHEKLGTSAPGQMGTMSAEHIGVGPGAISRVRADVYENPEAEVTNDGNTVNIEKEMTALAENSIMYKAAIQLINKKMAALKYAATDGGR